MPAVSPTGRSICEAAMWEIGVSASAGPTEYQVVLNKLARLVDNWNAVRAAIYADVFSTFALVPNLNPHTIGPTGATWTLARPVSIESVMLELPTSAPKAFVEVVQHDREWYDDISVPDLESTIPTDCFYNPTNPLGSLYFWPVPTAAYNIVLTTRTILTALDFTTAFAMPVGYLDAVTLTLAESIASGFAVPVPQQVALEAGKARARIWANNDVTPLLVTQDAGMPGGDDERGSFNYLSRTWSR